MGVEIERKFLINEAKWQQLAKPKGTPFKQGYMLKSLLKTIRVRVTDEQSFITIKGKTTGISRSEYEYKIPIAEGEELLDKFCDAIIVKTRYRIPYHGKTWEVDVFEGANSGLIVAELELENEAEQFEMPDWITIEVSGDERYYNSNLSVNPYTLWPKP